MSNFFLNTRFKKSYIRKFSNKLIANIKKTRVNTKKNNLLYLENMLN